MITSLEFSILVSSSGGHGSSRGGFCGSRGGHGICGDRRIGRRSDKKWVHCGGANYYYIYFQ